MVSRYCWAVGLDQSLNLQVTNYEQWILQVTNCGQLLVTSWLDFQGIVVYPRCFITDNCFVFNGLNQLNSKFYVSLNKPKYRSTHHHVLTSLTFNFLILFLQFFFHIFSWYKLVFQSNTEFMDFVLTIKLTKIWN